MSKVLYSFATSGNPDTYINALTYASEHKNIDRYHLVVISEHEYQNESESELWASTINANISTQLQALSEGKYYKYTEKELIKLRDINGIEVYEKCLKTINNGGSSAIVISIDNLDSRIRKFIRKDNCLFDVSALKKNLLVDVISILISINFNEVYSFELVKEPTYSQNDLYHNLSSNEFLFRKLTDSKPVKRSLARINKWTLRASLLLIFTIVVAIIFIPLFIYFPDSLMLKVLNGVALIAGVSSFFNTLTIK